MRRGFTAAAEGEIILTVINETLMTQVSEAVKIDCGDFYGVDKQVPDLLFSYLHLTLSGVFPFCSCVLITCQPDD